MTVRKELGEGSIFADMHRMPDSKEGLENPAVLGVLSSLLERVVSRNERKVLPSNLSKITVFHGYKPPTISIEHYLQRIFKYANCSTSCFVVAYIYIDRFIHHQKAIPITSLNVHRLLVTSVMLSAKFLDDSFYNNAYYAKVGGVTTQEMNRMEVEFLFKLDFRLQVTVSVFESYCTHLERELALGGLYQIEKSLQIGCRRDGESGQKETQSQRPAIRCSYAGM